MEVLCIQAHATWFHGEYSKETMMLIARGTEDNHLILVEKTKLLLRHKCTARDVRFKNKASSDYYYIYTVQTQQKKVMYKIYKHNTIKWSCKLT